VYTIMLVDNRDLSVHKVTMVKYRAFRYMLLKVTLKRKIENNID